MYKVMLVDDMSICIKQIKRMRLWTGETDFSIAAEASNGYDALEILRNSRIDLLITDIKMPKIDGIELLKEVMEKELCPCVVLLSDYTDFTFAKQGIQYGAFDYLGKPAEYDDMKSMLDRAEQFLQKKSQEIQMIRFLEERLEEKLEDLFPSVELEQLTEALRKKEPDVFKIAERLTDSIISIYENDSVKINMAFNRAMSELIRLVESYYGWIDKFINTTKYKGIDFSAMSDNEAAAAAFRTAVYDIMREIGQLEYGSSLELLENRISRYVLEKVDSEVSIKGIAQFMFLNPKYLSEVFRQRTGELLIEYITRIKMERAVRLLEHSSMKAYEIALLLGYKDTEYFSRLFKKYKGISPIDYRNGVGI